MSLSVTQVQCLGQYLNFGIPSSILLPFVCKCFSLLCFPLLPLLLSLHVRRLHVPCSNAALGASS